MSKHSVYSHFSARLRRSSKPEPNGPTSDSNTFKRELIQAIAPNCGTLAEYSTWYATWVQEQLRSIRHWLVECVEDFVPDGSEVFQPCIRELWKTVAEELRTNEGVSVDSLVALLVEHKVLKAKYKLSMCRHICCAIVGYQTMLWKLDIGSSPPTQLAIQDQMNGFSGQAGMTLRQDLSACRKVLPQFVMGFGVLLPSPRYWAHDDDDNSADKALKSLTTISPHSMNAHLFSSMRNGFAVRWTDVLAHHLEFDHREAVLYVYQYPSFCLASLDDDGTCTSTISACAEPTIKSHSPYWASKSEIAKLLQQTLLSYRLLFGQTKASRNYFRKLRSSHVLRARSEDDVLLSNLCTQKKCDLTDSAERDVYNLVEDFSMYRDRLVILSDALSKSKARTWRQLWHDKRDSAAWLTFWLVLLFGGIGVILQFVQVILQAISTAKGNS